MTDTEALLHRLWTWAVGKDGYVKADWRTLANAVEGFERDTRRRLEELAATLMLQWIESLTRRLEIAAQAYDDEGDERGAAALRAFLGGVKDGVGAA